MRSCLVGALLLVPALGGLGASGQTISGTVEKVGENELQLKGPEGPVTLRVGEKTTIRKGKTVRDLSALAVGDEVRVNYYGLQELTAVDISARVEVAGVITEAGKSRIIIVPGKFRTAAPDGKAVFVYLGPTTKFGASRSLLTVGRRIQVVGWDAGDAVIEAERVAIYDTDVPARHAPPQETDPPR